MSVNSDILSINIFNLRTKADLSQAALAEKAGVSSHTILRAESKGKTPRSEQLTRIAHALGVTVSDLYMDPNAKKKQKLVSEMTETELFEKISQSPDKAADEIKFLKAQFENVLNQLVESRSALDSERKNNLSLRSKLALDQNLSPRVASIAARLATLNDDQLDDVSGFIDDVIEYDSPSSGSSSVG